MHDINLIPEEVRKQKIEASRKRKLFVVSVIFLGLSFLASSGLFAYKYSLQRKNSEISSQISKEEQKINSLNYIADKMFVLGNKLSLVDKVLKERPSYSKFLIELGNVLPEGVYVTSLDTVTDTKISFSGITTSYVTLSNLIRNIVEDAQKDKSIFDYPELTSVSLKESEDKINFSMNLFLKKDALKFQ